LRCHFVWKEAKNTLTIGDRKGEFQGILKERTFNIVVVRENQGNGISIVETPDQVVKYNGTQLKVMLNE
jgi:alpha-D-xyloside xylohydrolase